MMNKVIRERIEKRQKEKTFHAKFLDNHVDVEWMVTTLRMILIGYKNKVHDADTALKQISDTIGVETTGGYVLK